MRVVQNSLYYLIPFLMILFMVIIWRGWHANQALSSPMVGKWVPTINLPILYHSGKRLTNQDFKGKVILLNFWASWCPPCHAEHPVLMMIKENDHIPIYGINFGDNPDNAKTMLKKRGNPYTAVGVDEDTITANLFGVTVLPQTFLIDTHGVIRYRYQGILDKRAWENVLLPMVQKIEQE